MATRKKKTVQPDNVVRIKIETSCYGEQDEGDGEQYGRRGDTHTSWDIENIKRGTENDSDLALKFVPTPGEQLYLVWLSQSTGDSFGNDEGKYFVPVEVYRDRDLAEKAIAAIREHADFSSKLHHAHIFRLTKDEKKAFQERAKAHEDFKLTLIGGDGKPYDEYTPWNGYFDSIYSIQICPFVLEN